MRLLFSSFKTFSALVCILLSFNSCFRDTCKETYEYIVYTPVYMQADEMRASVQTLPPTMLINPGKIYYKAPYLFVNELNRGIHIFDNSNPASPVNISFINIPGCQDMAVKGNILYADCSVDLLAFDISNPASVLLSSRLENVFPNGLGNDAFVADTLKGIVVNWTEKDTSIERECNNFNSWWEGDDFFIMANSFDGGSLENNAAAPGAGVAGSTAQFAISNDYLYCLVDGAMNLYNITNAAMPVAEGTVNMSWNVETIFPYGNYIFIGSTTGVQIFDNTNPASPAYISSFIHLTVCDPVVVSGNYAYSTLRSTNTCQGILNELDIIDISNIENPVLASSYQLNSPYGLGIDGSNLFICDGSDGVKYYNASDIHDLELKQTLSIEDSYDVIPLNGLLIITAADGIHQYDYSSGTLHPLSVISRLGS